MGGNILDGTLKLYHIVNLFLAASEQSRLNEKFQEVPNRGTKNAPALTILRTTAILRRYLIYVPCRPAIYEQQ